MNGTAPKKKTLALFCRRHCRTPASSDLPAHRSRADKDTYARFSVEGEGYLDKYGIDDAVRDGATVPILYEGRKTD
jgi:hypothetical protein